MQFQTLSAFFSLAACASAFFWAFDLTTLGLTPKELETRVAGGLRDGSNELQVPWLTNNARAAAKGLSEADRVAAVQAIGAALKAYVTSPAFQKTHAEQIKSSFKAVDHGIKVYSQEEMIQMAMKPKPGVDPIADMQKQLMAMGAMDMRKQPIAGLQYMFDDLLKSWTRKAQSASSPAAKAKAQKMMKRALEIQPWITSNPEEFKKAFTVLYSAENGGPDTEAELVALANRGQFEEEQRSFNEHNWKTVVKKKLEILVKEAATVDFAAQTTQAAGRTKFVNPAYEKKSGIWKAMFRAGKAPTLAAAEFSKAWLKEL
jgi:hypothetical protein